MIQRVFGVLAALAIVGGSAACSSSSSPAPTPVADTGVKSDAKTDTQVATDTGGNVPDSETGPVCGKDIDCTTGKPCPNGVDDCDITGNGTARCTSSGVYALEPLNATAICMQVPTTAIKTVCDPGTPLSSGDAYSIGCDGGGGMCVKSSGSTTAACEAYCQMDETGKWLTQCAGKNACSPAVFFNPASDATKNYLTGTCAGGCSADSDCPANSKCDPYQKICINVKCTADADCAKGWGGAPPAPANFKCNTAAGFCNFVYAKKPGDACTPSPQVKCTKDTDCTGANGTTCDSSGMCNALDECICIAGLRTTGICTSLCKTGSTDCTTGWSCDPGFTSKAHDGTVLFGATFALPAGVSGICSMNCTADTDCKNGQKCSLSAGMGTQKTCHDESCKVDTDCGFGQTCDLTGAVGGVGTCK
jgi:hypothetical protein